MDWTMHISPQHTTASIKPHKDSRDGEVEFSRVVLENESDLSMLLLISFPFPSILK